MANNKMYFVWVLIWALTIFVANIKALYFKGTTMYAINLILFVLLLLVWRTGEKSKRNSNIKLKNILFYFALLILFFGLGIYFNDFINKHLLSSMLSRVVLSTVGFFVISFLAYKNWSKK